MMGKKTPVRAVPYFWTVQGKAGSLRYCGHALAWDKVLVDGDLDAMKFVAYLINKDKVMAVVSLNRDPAVSEAAELMNVGKMPSGAELEKQLSVEKTITLPKL